MRRLLALACFVTACVVPAPTRVEHPARTLERATSAPLRIASFNIQIFGRTKAHNPEVMAQLARVVASYDVVAVQEIKDLTGEAPQLLLREVNAIPGAKYALLLSPRTGREPDDQGSQEAYAVFYNTATVAALPNDQLYDDSTQDLFQREPYLVHLRSVTGTFSAVLIDIHTAPARAVAEIGSLPAVYAYARQVFPDEPNIIALGDFNASCNYATPRQLDPLPIRSAPYRWMIPDTSNSNLASGSSCAYDRIVANANAAAYFTGGWGVDSAAFSDKRVSDHWPVWAEFRTAD